MLKMKLNIQYFAGGTIDGTSTSSGGLCRIVWSSTKNDTNNTSSVTATMQVRRSSGSTWCTVSGTLTIDGTSVNISKYRPESAPWNTTWKDVGSYTKTVAHNDDGTKSIKISSSCSATAGHLAGKFTASQTVALDTINRASKLGEIEDFALTDTITIPITKYVSTFTDKLEIKLGSTLIKTINPIVNGQSISFTTSEQTTIKGLMTSPQATLTFILTTYSGSTEIGSTTQNANVTTLDKPIYRNIIKKPNGHYQVAINGVVDANVSNTIQVYDDNGEDIFFYHSGDIIEIGSTTVSEQLFVTNGYITSGTTKVFLPIPVTKRLDNINTITCQSCNVEARGESGYLNSTSGFVEYVGKSGYTVTCGKASNNVIILIITKSSAWTNTSNNRLAGMSGYFKFKLN